MAAQGLLEMMCSVLCKRFTVEQAREILGMTFPLTVSATSLVCREGEEPSGLLIFVKGTAEVLKQGRDGTGQIIATVEAPTVLGEMSLVTDRARSATVRAKTDCEFRLLRRQDFARLLQSESVSAYKLIATIAEVLARRLYLMDEKVLELAAARDRPAPVEELVTFKQKLFSEWSF